MTEKYPDYDVKIINKEKIHEAYPGVSPEKYDEQLCEIAQEIIKKENDIGSGKSADVFRDPYNKTNLCYKFINRQNPIDLDPEDEASFLIELADFHDKVRVPDPSASISVKKVFDEKLKRFVTKKVLVMERIIGYSLEELQKNPSLIPPTYNHEEFFDDLTSFVLEMHKKGIHHRDLHGGNIMIETKTGRPVVIDFGRSLHTTENDENAYRQEYLLRDEGSGKYMNKMVTFTPDLDFIADTKVLMAKALRV